MSKSKKLQDLPDSGVKSVDTPDPHHNGELGFRGDVVVAMLAGVTGQTHFVVLSLAVLFNVLLGTLKDGGALGFGLMLIKVIFSMPLSVSMRIRHDGGQLDEGRTNFP